MPRHKGISGLWKLARTSSQDDTE